jgi:hypothetical protein
MNDGGERADRRLTPAASKAVLTLNAASDAGAPFACAWGAAPELAGTGRRRVEPISGVLVPLQPGPSPAAP